MGVRGYEAVQSRSYAEIEVVAGAFRRFLGLGPAERISGIDLFGRLDEILVSVDGLAIGVDTGVKELEWGVEGRSLYNSQTGKFDLLLAEATYDRLRRNEPRAVFTLCHECGHIALHSQEMLAPPASLSLDRARHPHYRDTEWQGDAFAASFLAPHRGLRELERGVAGINVLELKRHFGLSSKAAEIRIANYQKNKKREGF